MTIDFEAMRTWLENSCALQGVAVVVTDAGVVARVGVLLRGRDAAGGRAATAAASGPSAAPRGHDPERVERSASAGGGLDGGEVEDSADDRRLSAKVQRLPTCPQGFTVAD